MNFCRLIAVGVILLLPITAMAGGKKGDPVGIAFHIETTKGENPKMIFPHEDKVFRRIPEVTSRDIASFNPFPARDGQGYGVLLRLKPAAKNRLSAVTAANIGRWLLARVSGKVVDASMIDQPINDGELVIWRGLTLGEVKALDKLLPRLGQKKPRG